MDLYDDNDMDYSCESFMDFCDRMMIADEGLFENVKRKHLAKKWSKTILYVPENKWNAFSEFSDMLKSLQREGIEGLEIGEGRALDDNSILRNDHRYKTIIGADSGKFIEVDAQKPNIEMQLAINNMKNAWKRHRNDPDFKRALECLREITNVQIDICEKVLTYKKNGAI